jgi:hypothetical protein
MNRMPFLLPRGFRLPGICLALAGLAEGIARFVYGWKPAFLNLKQFEVFSYYMEPKYFSVITNHAGEEIAGLLLTAGLFLTAFSRERTESETTATVRLRAFMLAACINTLLIVLSLLFLFGFGFVYAMVINLFSFLLIYILAFRILMLRRPGKLTGD